MAEQPCLLNTEPTTYVYYLYSDSGMDTTLLCCHRGWDDSSLMQSLKKQISIMM